jgi:DNA polymerase III subunit delta
MPATSSHEAFQKAVQARQFAPAYYLHGDEGLLKEEAVQRIIAAAVEPATRAFNLDQLSGASLTAEAIGTILGTPPMMAARRVVVIRDVDELRKDAHTLLIQYLTRPAPDSVLVLVASGAAKRDKQLGDATSDLEFTALSGAQLPDWITQRANALGATITRAAVVMLQSVVGDDLSQLSLEIQKLASYATHGEITEDAVSDVVGIRRDQTLGHLLDAVARRDAGTALAVLPVAMEQPRASAVTTVMALTVQTLALAWGEASGLSAGRLAREYYNFLKQGGSVFVGRAWGEAVPAWSANASRWTRGQLDHALDALARADLALKETRISSDEQILSTLILTICGTPTQRSAA